MIGSLTVLALSLGYVGVLFSLAWHGDRQARLRGRALRKPMVYALSLAVYCTSWTFYGSVGLAARAGYRFLPIYLGPILVFAVGWPLVRRVVRISKAHSITSIADFIAARHGKSQALAAAVTVIAVIGTLPYIALQLKAVSASFVVLVDGPAPLGAAAAALSGYAALAVTLVLAAFSILFGTRHIDATEHHDGMMLAIAFESVVKLAAFLAVGCFVTWGMFDGLGALAARVDAQAPLRALFLDGVDGTAWVTMTGLALVAVLCLPRQFHVAIVENADERDLKRAAWLFPLYLVAINLFVVPIAVAGLSVFHAGGVDADMFVLALPMVAGAPLMALVAFIGGFSAATGMVIVSSLAISNMVSNHLAMPIILRRRRHAPASGGDMGALILHVRRAAILGLLLLAYCCYRLLADDLALASIGLLSFAATAQFAPALLGGLVWRGGTARGALCGIISGFLVWAYTLLLPSLARAGWWPLELVEQGPFGIGLLRPEQLFGLRFDPLTHGVLWSLLVNAGCYVLLSLIGTARVIERIQAGAFVDFDPASEPTGPRTWSGSIRVAELVGLVARYLGHERAERSLREFAGADGGAVSPSAPADFRLVRHSERLLAGAIGAPSARLVMALALERQHLGVDGAMGLLDDASAAIQYSHELLQSTLDTVSQGISVFDRDLRLVCWNARFGELFGLPAHLLRVGVPLQALLRFAAEHGELGHAADLDAAVARELRLLLAGGGTARQRRRPDGTMLELRTSPMPGGGHVTTYADVTAYVRATGELATANASLEHRVHLRTAELLALNTELSRAKVAAETANQGKTRFIAAASHDLLQPLNAARLYVSSLIEGQGDAGGGDRELAQKIDASLSGVEELLGTLLDISRLDAGALQPERRDVPLGALFELLRVEFSPLAARKGLDLRIVPTALTADSDRALLYRVLQNLLSNAIRYTAAGRIVMGVRRAGSTLEVQVWDTGYGIAPEVQGLVFKEFHRFAPAPGAEHGLGLGLSIVERISRILGHEVRFRSTPGRGTMFGLRLPRGRSLPAEPAPASPGIGLPGVDRPTVLCIDNDRGVQDGMRILLERWSCRVRLAAGLDEALALARREPRPDILLVDYHLDAAADGLQCVVALQAALKHQVPSIIITADRSEALKQAAQAKGFPVLHKPVRPAALRALLTRQLAASHDVLSRSA